MLLSEIAPHAQEKPETVDEVFEKLKRDKAYANVKRDGDWITFTRRALDKSRDANDFILKRRELFVVVDGKEYRIRKFVDTAKKIERATVFVNRNGTHYPEAK